jgi:hypothetical protein
MLVAVDDSLSLSLPVDTTIRLSHAFLLFEMTSSIIRVDPSRELKAEILFQVSEVSLTLASDTANNDAYPFFVFGLAG